MSHDKRRPRLSDDDKTDPLAEVPGKSVLRDVASMLVDVANLLRHCADKIETAAEVLSSLPNHDRT